MGDIIMSCGGGLHRLLLRVNPGRLLVGTGVGSA
jgi:hypothetical protein